MGMNKARIGFILGIIVALLIGTADIPGLARNGQICMALSFMTVIFWGFQSLSRVILPVFIYYSSQFLGLKNLLSFFRPGLVQ